MPRACVIVLDAVGAARASRRRQSAATRRSTTRSDNVARAVGGLDLPSLEALGLGNVEPLEGCPPQAGRAGGRRPAARALEGQGHDDRPLGADGHRHAAADARPIRTAFPHDVIDPFMHQHRPRRARQQAGVRAPRSSRSSARSTSGRASGSSTRRPTPSSRSPRTRRRSRSRSSTTGCRVAARDPHRQARRRARDRTAVHRRAGQLRAHAEPARLLARAADVRTT